MPLKCLFFSMDRMIFLATLVFKFRHVYKFCTKVALMCKVKQKNMHKSGCFVHVFANLR